jgi:hypothetical protein
MHTFKRQIGGQHDAQVIPLFPSHPGANAAPTCSECGTALRAKKPASHCGAKCRALAFRRRHREADVAKLHVAEAALEGALLVLRELRVELSSRGAP